MLRKFFNDLKEYADKIMFIIIFIIASIVIYKINTAFTDDVQKFQAIGNLFVVLSALFVGFQAYLSLKDYRKKNARLRIQKAIEIAELFANKVIKNVYYINSVFKDTGLAQVFESIPLRKMINFDVHELNSNLTPEQIKSIKETLANADSKIFFKARLNLNKDLYRNFSSTDETALKIDLIVEFDSIISDTLNTLEYICMYFNSGVADEEAVYQSLHQSFLTVIKALYHHIAIRNENGKDKYYTNIIELFNVWSFRHLKNDDLEIASRRNFTTKCKKI